MKQIGDQTFGTHPTNDHGRGTSYPNTVPEYCIGGLAFYPQSFAKSERSLPFCGDMCVPRGENSPRARGVETGIDERANSLLGVSAQRRSRFCYVLFPNLAVTTDIAWAAISVKRCPARAYKLVPKLGALTGLGRQFRAPVALAQVQTAVRPTRLFWSISLMHFLAQLCMSRLPSTPLSILQTFLNLLDADF